MSKALTLSIIIPVYNESDHLKNCLDSIQKQTIMPGEVIVVDNNSTDDSVAIARKYSFVKIISEKQQGIVYARNAGFNAATSNILGRIDADSILPEDWVAKVLDFYKDNDHLKLYAWTSQGYWYNVSHPKIYSWFFDQIVFRFNRFILGHYPLWGSSMAMTRDSWLRVKDKVCPRNDIHEDLDLSIHLHQLGYQISYVTGIAVGTYVKRVYSDFGKFWGYSLLWPRTLRVHKLIGWYLGLIGAVIIYLITPPLILEAKILSLFLNKKFQ